MVFRNGLFLKSIDLYSFSRLLRIWLVFLLELLFSSSVFWLKGFFFLRKNLNLFFPFIISLFLIFSFFLFHFQVFINIFLLRYFWILFSAFCLYLQHLLFFSFFFFCFSEFLLLHQLGLLDFFFKFLFFLLAILLLLLAFFLGSCFLSLSFLHILFFLTLLPPFAFFLHFPLCILFKFLGSWLLQFFVSANICSNDVVEDVQIFFELFLVLDQQFKDYRSEITLKIFFIESIDVVLVYLAKAVKFAFNAIFEMNVLFEKSVGPAADMILVAILHKLADFRQPPFILSQQITEDVSRVLNLKRQFQFMLLLAVHLLQFIKQRIFVNVDFDAGDLFVELVEGEPTDDYQLIVFVLFPPLFNLFVQGGRVVILLIVLGKDDHPDLFLAFLPGQRKDVIFDVGPQLSFVLFLPFKSSRDVAYRFGQFPSEVRNRVAREIQVIGFLGGLLEVVLGNAGNIFRGVLDGTGNSRPIVGVKPIPQILSSLFEVLPPSGVFLCHVALTFQGRSVTGIEVNHRNILSVFSQLTVDLFPESLQLLALLQHTIEGFLVIVTFLAPHQKNHRHQAQRCDQESQ